MSIYTVYINPKAPSPLETTVFIEEGVSFFAIIFHWIWMLSHKMWWQGIVTFIIMNIAVPYMTEKAYMNAETATKILGALVIWIGINANDWWRNSLSRKGFVLYDIVSAKNKEAAEQRFYDQVIPSIQRQYSDCAGLAKA